MKNLPDFESKSSLASLEKSIDLLSLVLPTDKAGSLGGARFSISGLLLLVVRVGFKGTDTGVGKRISKHQIEVLNLVQI